MKPNIYKIGQMIQNYFSVLLFTYENVYEMSIFLIIFLNVRKVNKTYMMKQAGLIPRQWDGMLKYIQISQKMIDERHQTYAKQLGLVERGEDDEFSASMSASVQK
ncbi:Lysophosphatidic_acid acyltransferase/Glycerol-3-phosphate 1-O-acyltransferase [Hexamita inflata]|uniref:Lysophosphatidic acid acyltransferase/Glycerol-3-phosphate 1-O-acyltransferase n=1 Tax=Hexamita inflata TaxID=28002 RepID=A0AA86QVN3_9EUKA|nr:Lysophosphatidic acid acyltransferase/Glycerol-3-phosphate 1-O-acyltransferase [Hexamita inflata]